jgi:hypothetical protein
MPARSNHFRMAHGVLFARGATQRREGTRRATKERQSFRGRKKPEISQEGKKDQEEIFSDNSFLTSPTFL